MKKKEEKLAGFNVWFQSVAGDYAERIGEIDDSDLWSVHSQASDGDLVLFYRTAPQSCIVDIFIVEGPVVQTEAGWKDGLDYMAAIRRICTLEEPLCWKDLKGDDRLGNASFVKMQMQGRHRATDYWHVLLQMIVANNPALAWLQQQYNPNKIRAKPRKM
jgi:hypothetical protein